MMKKLLNLIFILFLLGSRGVWGQSISSYQTGITELIYTSIADFTNGVNSNTFTMTLTNLDKNQRYYVYVRTSASAFVATPMPSPSVPNIPLSEVSFEALSVTNSSSPAITNITRNTIPLARYTSSTRNNAILLAAFNTPNNNNVERSTYVVTITYRVVGPTDLCVAGNNNTSPAGLAYGAPAPILYDLDESDTNGSSTGWQDQSNSGHSVRIRVKDALEFTVNQANTDFLVYLPSTNPVTVTIPNQFTIRSNENVSLTVISESPNLTSTTTNQTIPVSNFDIKINTFSNIGGTNTYATSYQTLSGASSKTLASSLGRFLNNNISMSYLLASPNNLSGKTPAVYTTSLLFTVTQL